MNLLIYNAIVFSLCSQFDFAVEEINTTSNNCYNIPHHNEMLFTINNINSNNAIHDISSKRKLWFVIEPSYSNLWIDGELCFAAPLALDLGLKYKKNYFGLNYNIISFGGFFQYYYDLDIINEIISICPGVCTGFWYAHVGSYGWQHFIGGPTIKTKIGYKRIFGTLTYNLTIGSKVVHILKIGCQIVL